MWSFLGGVIRSSAIRAVEFAGWTLTSLVFPGIVLLLTLWFVYRKQRHKGREVLIKRILKALGQGICSAAVIAWLIVFVFFVPVEVHDQWATERDAKVAAEERATKLEADSNAMSLQIDTLSEKIRGLETAPPKTITLPAIRSEPFACNRFTQHFKDKTGVIIICNERVDAPYEIRLTLNGRPDSGQLSCGPLGASVTIGGCTMIGDEVVGIMEFPSLPAYEPVLIMISGSVEVISSSIRSR